MGSVAVSSARLANGDILFSIKTSSKSSGVHYGTSLGTVQISEYGQSSIGIRGLPSDQNGGVLECVFSVTPKELENPDLCFRLTRGGDMWMATYFIRLKKFLPS